MTSSSGDVTSSDVDERSSSKWTSISDSLFAFQSRNSPSTLPYPGGSRGQGQGLSQGQGEPSDFGATFDSGSHQRARGESGINAGDRRDCSRQVIHVLSRRTIMRNTQNVQPIILSDMMRFVNAPIPYLFSVFYSFAVLFQFRLLKLVGFDRILIEEILP